MYLENNRKTRLQKLSGSDFEIADGQSDIRGWDVFDSSGKKLGEVAELIFDYQSQKVRYLVVDLNSNEYDLEQRKVLVPIGIAELHEKDDEVILPDVSVDQLRALPGYSEDRFDTEHETNIRNVFGGLGAATSAADIRKEEEDFYNHAVFNDANLYRNRHKAGEDPSYKAATEGLADDYREAPDGLRTSGIRLRSRNINMAEGSDPAELRNDMEKRNEYDEEGKRKEYNRDYD